MDAFISSSVLADNSTSLLVQNALLNDVDIYIVDESRHEALLAGDGNEERIGSIESWGFGRVVDSKGNPSLTQGGSIEAPERDPSMTTPGLSPSLRKTEYYFRRSRPRYADLGGCDFVDVRAWGAKGDGQSDDTAILNYIFSAAANMSAVVFIPHGVYIIKDTVTIPVGSRVIGQAWPQMMGVGPKFEDTYHPRPVFRVGVPGNQGVVEIQSLLFTTRGPTAGAVLLEWNVHESFQGSCGLWGNGSLHSLPL